MAKHEPKAERRPEETPSHEVEVFRLGKDEMNLVEHPFAALWKNTDKNTSLVLHWQVRHPDSGKMLKAAWRVEGSQEWGLPTTSDERLYLVLMELTRENGWAQTVHFSRYEVLKRMGWTDNDKHYRMVEEGLARLAGVYITAKNAFWNPRARNFAALVGFHILEQFEVFPEVRGRKKKDAAASLSFFKWNDAVFQSFVDGNIRSIDLNFALSLKRPLTLRLFRFLDKKANDGRRTYDICLRDLCGEHLGMAVEGRYDADLRAGLKPAHAELIERGFLKSAAFEPMKSRSGDKVCYEFVPQPQRGRRGEVAEDEEPAPLLPPPESAQTVANEAAPTSATALPNGPATLSEATKPIKSEANTLLRRMIEVGVSPAVAEELLRTVATNQLRLQLDCLSDRDAKNPAAVFIKSVRELWALPPAYLARVEAVEAAERAQKALDDSEHAKARERALKRQQMALADEEAAQLDARYEQLDERNRKRIDDEATKRLGIVAHLGKNEGALRAMRRQVIREMLEQVGAVPQG